MAALRMQYILVFHLEGGALGYPPPKIVETNYIMLDHKLQSFFVMLILVKMGLKCDLRACKLQKFSGGHAPRPLGILSLG